MGNLTKNILENKEEKSVIIVRQTLINDILPLSLIHLKAFKNHMNARLGRKYAGAFIKWFIENSNAICLTATADEKTMGYVCGAALGYNQKMNKDLLRTVAGCFLFRPYLFFNKELMNAVKIKIQILLGNKSLLKDAVKDPSGRGISLVSICSDTNSTIKGIGTVLINEFEKQAKLLGFDFMRLSVKPENVKAINFYEHNGWQLLQNNQNILYYFKKL